MFKIPIFKIIEKLYLLAKINLKNCISKKHEIKD